MSDSYQKPDQNKIVALKDIANKLRVHSVEATDAANSGCVQTYSIDYIDSKFMMYLSMPTSAVAKLE